MATVRLNPNVENFIVRMDWADARNDVPGFADELVRTYEDGKLIILKNAPFRIDYDLLNQVSVPKNPRFQKLSDRFITVPKLYRRDVAAWMWQTFADRPLVYPRFRSEVQRVSAQVRDFIRLVFRDYRFLKTGVSWRFTPTHLESLHLDYFNPKHDVDYVRLFINIDRAPRVWTVSHQLDELILRYAQANPVDALQGARTHDVTQTINHAMLYPLTKLPPEETDRHVIEFEQGDVWMCETRLNSHQILDGHRMIATDFYVDPTSMRDPSKRVRTRIERTLERCHKRADAAIAIPAAAGPAGASVRAV
jgi:hypothetical protein